MLCEKQAAALICIVKRSGSTFSIIFYCMKMQHFDEIDQIKYQEIKICHASDL